MGCVPTLFSTSWFWYLVPFLDFLVPGRFLVNLISVTLYIKICSGVQNRVGTPHIKMCSDVQNRVGTPHIKMCLHVHTRVGTPHMPIGVFDQMFKLGWGHCTRSKMFESTNAMGRVGGWWMGGWVTIRIIMPLRGSILQVGTCQILS